jgi:hypothetical protein
MRNGIDAAVAATSGIGNENVVWGSILNEIAMHTEVNPNWLDLSAAL